MSNEELVTLIQSGVDVQHNMGELYQQTKNFIYSIIYPYAKNMGSSIPYKDNGKPTKERPTTVLEKEDLMQETYFALQQAVDGYDASKGFLFTTYLTRWIKSKTKRYVLDNNTLKRIPEHELMLMSKYHKFIREYKLEQQEEPSEKEIMDALDITEKKLHELIKCIHESNIQSIDSVIPGTDSMTITETVADDYDLEADVLGRIEVEQGKQELWDAVDELDERQQTVIVGRYKNNLTQGEVSKTVGVSLSRIGQIEQKALRVLRKKEKVQRLAEEFGYDCSIAYRRGVGRFKNTNTSSTEWVALKHIELEQKNASLNDMFDKIMMMV